MAPKPGKENKASQKPTTGKADTVKSSAKSKKEKEEDDDDLDDELDQDDDAKASPIKSAPKTKKPKDADDSDDDDDVAEDEADDWEKPETEEEWDPDFDEFDIPKSRGKKVSGKKEEDSSAGGADEDFKFDDDLKEFDMFNDSGSFDDDDDDF